MDLIEFEWLRCQDGAGYRVAPSRSPKPVVRLEGKKAISLPQWTGKDASGDSIETIGKKQFGLYPPAQHYSALFQIFADKPATAEGICEFFNAFGPLELPGGARPRAGPAYHSVSLRCMLVHQAALRHAIDLFNAGNLVDFTAGFNVGCNLSRGQLRPELRPLSDGKLGLAFVPSSLIQFLWLQLALHAASDAELLRCAQCGMPFCVGTGTARRNTARYCSNRCKVAAYKARKGI